MEDIDTFGYNRDELQREESREAIQKGIDERNAKFAASLSPVDKAKFDAVNEGLKILTAAGVQAYVFPMIKEPSYGKEVIYQYHNLETFIKWENGKLSKETMIEASWMNHCLVNSLFQVVSNFVPKNGNKFSVLNQILADWNNWYHNDVIPPGIKRLTERP